MASTSSFGGKPQRKPGCPVEAALDARPERNRRLLFGDHMTVPIWSVVWVDAPGVGHR